MSHDMLISNLNELNLEKDIVIFPKLVFFPKFNGYLSENKFRLQYLNKNSLKFIVWEAGSFNLYV